MPTLFDCLYIIFNGFALTAPLLLRWKDRTRQIFWCQLIISGNILLLIASTLLSRLFFWGRSGFIAQLNTIATIFNGG